MNDDKENKSTAEDKKRTAFPGLCIPDQEFESASKVFNEDTRITLNHSDEGLMLETSVFKSFTVANLPYRTCG